MDRKRGSGEGLELRKKFNQGARLSIISLPPPPSAFADGGSKIFRRRVEKMLEGGGVFKVQYVEETEIE
jgi:hypothetical protein